MSNTLTKEAPATGGFKPKKSVALSGVTYFPQVEQTI